MDDATTSNNIMTVMSRVNTSWNHGYKGIAENGRASNHIVPVILQWLLKKERPKRSRFSGPYIPYGLFQTKGEPCAKFGSNWFRNVDLYKVQKTNIENKQTFIYISKINCHYNV
jgi:hypothetical protein